MTSPEVTGEPTDDHETHHESGSESDHGPSGLLSNVGALLGSRVIQAVLGWAGTVLIARSLGLDGFGRFTVIFTILGLMSVVTDLGVGRAALRGLLDKGADLNVFAGAYIGLRCLLGAMGYAVAVIVVVILDYPTEVLIAMALAGIVVVLSTYSAALDTIFQARMGMGTVGFADSLGILAQFAFTAAIVAGGGTLLFFMIPAIVFEVVVLAWKLPRARRLVSTRPRINTAVWRRLLTEAAPLAVGFGLATVYTKVDLVMLSKLDGFDSTGIYGVSYKFVDIVHSVSSAVTLPLLTLMVAAWPSDPARFREAIRRGALLLGLLGGLALTGLLGWATQATELLYGADYSPGGDTTRVLALAEMFNFAVSLAMLALVAVAAHRGYPLVMFIGLVLNVIINIPLINAYSYLGAGIATLISNVIICFLMWWLLLRIPNMRPLSLGRLAWVPVAVAAGVGGGLLVDLVLPWWVAAALSGVIYLGAVTALGVTRAAGMDVQRIRTVLG